MPPQLNDTWGGTYLHVLVVLLVFAFSIPSIISQIAQPEELRRIVHRRMRMTSWYFLMGSMIFSCLLFVWILHPASSECPPIWISYSAAGILTVVFISSLFFASRRIGIPTRSRIIRSLEKGLIDTFRKSEVLEEASINDLIYLGEYGNGGDEKTLVLEATDKIAKYVQQSQRYDGSQLENLIRGFDTMTGAKAKPGSDNNFVQACDILERIWNRHVEKGTTSSLDAGLCHKILGKLGVISIELRTESTSLRFLEAGSSEGNMLYEMGLSALRNKKCNIATAALCKLEGIADHTVPLTTEKTGDLFGLISHFWVLGGAAKQRCEVSLSIIKGMTSTRLKDFMKGAFDYHYSLANYEAADNLTRMIEEYNE